MSRTRRNTEHANINARRIKHHNRRTQELKAYDDIMENFGSSYISNRLRNWKSIPTNWNDKDVSGYGETRRNEND